MICVILYAFYDCVKYRYMDKMHRCDMNYMIDKMNRYDMKYMIERRKIEFPMRSTNVSLLFPQAFLIIWDESAFHAISV